MSKQISFHNNGKNEKNENTLLLNMKV